LYLVLLVLRRDLGQRVIILIQILLSPLFDKLNPTMTHELAFTPTSPSDIPRPVP
jgi:hypothetical protein